jgi:hypothetical protein
MWGVREQKRLNTAGLNDRILHLGLLVFGLYPLYGIPKKKGVFDTRSVSETMCF